MTLKYLPQSKPRLQHQTYRALSGWSFTVQKFVHIFLSAQRVSHLILSCSPIASALPRFKSRKSMRSILYTFSIIPPSLLYFCAVPGNTIRNENVRIRLHLTLNLLRTFCLTILWRKYVDWNEQSIVHALVEIIPTFDTVKVINPPLSGWFSHIAVNLRIRNEKKIFIASARIFILWKELIYFRLFESQLEIADSTGRVLSSLKKCKEVFVYWASLLFALGNLPNKRAL